MPKKKNQAAELVYCGEFILHTNISTFVYNIVYEKEELHSDEKYRAHIHLQEADCHSVLFAVEEEKSLTS